MFAGGVLVALLGVGAFFVARTVETRSSEAVGAELGALEACLLGDPLAAGETPAARFRRAQLTEVTIPEEQRAKPGELAWPGNCAVYALSVSERLGGPASPGVGAALASLGNTLKDDAWGPKTPEQIELAFKEITAKNLKSVAVTNVPVAPKPASVTFDADKFAALPRALSGKFSLAHVKPESSPRGTVRFVLDAKEAQDGTLLCTATPGASAAVKCVKVPPPVAAVAPGVVLGGTADPGALPAYGTVQGVFVGPTGDKAGTGVLLGGHVRADGSATLLLRPDGQREAKLVTMGPKSGAADKGVLDPKITATSHAGLGFDLAMWFAGKPGAMHWYARKVGPTGLDPAPAVDVGEWTEAPSSETKESQLDFCKTDQATIARARVGKNDLVAVTAGGRWSIPMKGGPAGGTLTCRGLEGVLTHVEHQLKDDHNWATISYTTCNLGECKSTKVALRDLLGSTPQRAPVDTKSIVVADVGGKLALVWNAGWLGGVRVRLAAPDRLKETPDTVIYDGQEAGAMAGLSSFAEMKLLPFEDEALLLLSTTSGVRALRIDKDGKVSPVLMTL